jgi:branched-chain amino acid transport system ATP-binding protein
MLEVTDLHAYYGKSHILQGVSLNVQEGEIVAVLGRNGVGRSTTCKAIMGEVPPIGSVKFKGEEMVGKKSYEIAKYGLGYVPENRDIFPGMTTKQNLLLGLNQAKKTAWVIGASNICSICSPTFANARTWKPRCYPAVRNRC